MNTSPSSRRFRLPCLPDLLSVAVLLLGVLARVARAWAGRASLDVDQSVVGLMARHMAQGTDFPLFFYGQSYMGSLEPSASALMFRLFGESGFTLGLGPVLFGCIALWALWRWGRDAAGPWGGLLAALGGLFGPLMHFQFQAAARGGYMVALAIGVLALSQSARMAGALREGRAVRLRAWIGLGLLAGVGLWSNLIVVPSLAVAALLLGWGMRWRPWRQWRGIAAAAAATVAGVSPWLWDIARRGGMDSLVQGGGSRSLAATLRCMADNYRMFLDGDALPRAASVACVAAATSLALLGAAVAFASRRRATPTQNAVRAAAVLFAVLFAGVYGTSSFATVSTGRYWIPLAPSLALLSALACTLPRRRAVRAVALAVFAAVFACQTWLAVTGMLGTSARSAELDVRLRTDVAGLQDAGVREILAPTPFYYLNFHSAETVSVSDGHKGFYRPNLRRTELSENPWWSTEYPGIRAWLAYTGAGHEALRVGRYSLVGNLHCPLQADRPLTDALPCTTSGVSLPDLADRRADTGWAPPPGSPAVLEWTLPAATPLSSLRIQLPVGERVPWYSTPAAARIEIPDPDSPGGWLLWRDLTFPPLATSLGRPYPAATVDVREIPLARLETDRLRVTLLPDGDPAALPPVRIAEAALFALDTDAPPAADRADLLLSPDAVRAVADFIRGPADSIWFYAPRRLSGLLVTREGIDPARLGGLPPDGFETSPAAAVRGAVPRDRVVGFCVESRMVPAAETALRASGRIWGAMPSGSWTIFVVDFQPDAPCELLWDGDAPLSVLPPRTVDAQVDDILSTLAAGLPADEPIRDLASLRPESLAALPADAVTAVDPALADLRTARGAIPSIPLDAVFRDGLRLRGLDVVPAAARPGGTVAITLYWQSTGRPHSNYGETTFIHLCDAEGRIVAQTDWLGPANVPGRSDFGIPLHECLSETRLIALPSDLPPGPLQIRIGRHRPGWRWRVPLTAAGTGTSVAQRALRIDGHLAVVP